MKMVLFDRHVTPAGSATGARLLALAAVMMTAGCGGTSHRPVVAQCVYNSDCAAPLVCAQGYCVSACSASRDCPGDQRCIVVGAGATVCQAPAKKTCAYNSDCAPLYCGVDLQCRNQCLSSADCLSGQICTATSKLCVDPIKDAPHYDPASNELLSPMDARAAEAPDHRGQACAYNDDCWPLLCAPDRLCHPRCQTQADCLDGERCTSSTKVCVVPVDGGLYDPARNDFPEPASARDAGADASADAGRGDGADARGPAPWHLWLFVASPSGGTHVYGYAPEQIQAASSDQPEIDLALPPQLTASLGDVLTFDRQGNLWASGVATANPTGKLLMRIGPAQQRASGVVTPEASAYLSGSATFDPAGNIWSNTSSTAIILRRFDAADIAALTATPSALPPRYYSTYPSQGPIAFDGTGNLYTQFSGVMVGRFDAATIAGQGLSNTAPAWTSTFAGAGSPNDLLFTPAGDLLVVQSLEIYRFSKLQIGASGAGDTTAPEAHLTVAGAGTFDFALNAALDPDGNLLLSDVHGAAVVKIDAADLARTGTASVRAHIVVRAPDSSTSLGRLAVH